MWQVQEVEAHLGEVIERACREGPQIITRHGTEQAVILSIEEIVRSSGAGKNFIDHLLGGPKLEDFEIERDKDTGREVDL